MAIEARLARIGGNSGHLSDLSRVILGCDSMTWPCKTCPAACDGTIDLWGDGLDLDQVGIYCFRAWHLWRLLGLLYKSVLYIDWYGSFHDQAPLELSTIPSPATDLDSTLGSVSRSSLSPPLL